MIFGNNIINRIKEKAPKIESIDYNILNDDYIIYDHIRPISNKELKIKTKNGMKELLQSKYDVKNYNKIILSSKLRNDFVLGPPIDFNNIINKYGNSLVFTDLISYDNAYYCVKHNLQFVYDFICIEIHKDTECILVYIKNKTTNNINRIQYKLYDDSFTIFPVRETILQDCGFNNCYINTSLISFYYEIYFVLLNLKKLNNRDIITKKSPTKRVPRGKARSVNSWKKEYIEQKPQYVDSEKTDITWEYKHSFEVSKHYRTYRYCKSCDGFIKKADRNQMKCPKCHEYLKIKIKKVKIDSYVKNEGLPRKESNIIIDSKGEDIKNE